MSQTGEEMMERWNVGVADMRSDEIPCAPRETERESEERRREDGEDCGVLGTFRWMDTRG